MAKSIGELTATLDQNTRKWISDFLGKLKEHRSISRSFFRPLHYSFMSSLELNELANTIGESVAIIKAWVNQGAPRNQDGSFSLTAFIQWYKEYQKRDLEDYEKARTRKTEAQATLAEMEVAEEERRLVDRTLIMRVHDQRTTTASKRISDLPRIMARIIPESQRAAFIKDAEAEVLQILKDLADPKEYQDIIKNKRAKKMDKLDMENDG